MPKLEGFCWRFIFATGYFNKEKPFGNNVANETDYVVFQFIYFFCFILH